MLATTVLARDLQVGMFVEASDDLFGISLVQVVEEQADGELLVGLSRGTRFIYGPNATFSVVPEWFVILVQDVA